MSEPSLRDTAIPQLVRVARRVEAVVGPDARRLLLPAIVLMSIAASIWLPYQFWRLLLSAHPVWPGSPPGAIDLQMRADEVARWFSGQPLYGAIPSAVYLPASLLMLWPFVGWLPFAVVRWLWGTILLASLAWLTSIVVREAMPRARLEHTFVCLLPLSLYATGASIGNGQLTIPVIALVLAALTRLRERESSWRGDTVAAGLFLLALSKPDVTAPFFWILVTGARSFRPAILVIAGYLALTVAAFLLHGVHELAPLESVLLGRLLWGAGLQFGELSSSFETGKVLILLAGLVGLLILAAWTYLHRDSDMWPILGVTAIITRLGFYHHWYDDLLFLIPMVALFRLTHDQSLSARRSFCAAALLAAMTALMIAPGGLFLLPPPLNRFYVAAQMATWVAALVFLIDHTRRDRSRRASGADANTGLCA